MANLAGPSDTVLDEITPRACRGQGSSHCLVGPLSDTRAWVLRRPGGL